MRCFLFVCYKCFYALTTILQYKTFTFFTFSQNSHFFLKSQGLSKEILRQLYYACLYSFESVFHAESKYGNESYFFKGLPKINK